MFDRAAEIKAVVDGIKPAKSVKIFVGQTSLGVNDPEQYRPELIKAIAADVKLVTYKVEMKRVINRRLVMGIGDAVLLADGKPIYEATDLRVGLFQAGGLA